MDEFDVFRINVAGYKVVLDNNRAGAMQGLCMEYGVQYIVDVSTTNHPADADTETPYRVGDNAPGSTMIIWCLAWYCKVRRANSLGYPLY